MFKLKNLHIKRFRNVQPGTRLDFAEGFNVLLGKNGAGKTTLLRLLEAITTSSFAPFKDEAFDLDYEWARTEGRIVVHVENVRREEPADVTPALRLLDRVQVDAQYSEQLRVEFAVSDVDGTFEALVETVDGRTMVTRGGVRTPLQGAPLLPTDAAFLGAMMAAFVKEAPNVTLSNFFMDVVTTYCSRFDESLGYYTEVKAREFSVWTLRRTRPAEFHPRGFLFFPGEDATLVNGTTISFNASDVPFLATFIAALGGIKAAELQLNIASKEATGRTVYAGLRLWLTRLDGSAYSDDKLSYGQKRLFSFLYYLAANPHTVIADELVNGLHHDWIDVCVREIGDRQAFLTSQNPLLMDHLSFESIEDVRRAFVLCQLGYDGDTEVLHWRNMTPDEAGSVFAAGEVGIEHLSTILRNEGLW